MSSHLNQFTEYTEENAAKGRAEDANAGWMKTQPGTNVVRILPPLKGMTEPWITIYQHFIKVPGGSQVVFNCPRRMANQACPACEKADRLKAAGDAASEKSAQDYWPAQRNIAFAIDRDDPEKGAQLFPFGATIKKRLRHFREKLKNNYTDFKTGSDIVIEKSGQGMKTEYQCDLGGQCAITDSKKQLEEWVSDLPNLNDFAKVMDYDAIMQKFSATAGEGAPPQQRQVGGSTKTSSIDDDAGSVDDEDDGDAF